MRFCLVDLRVLVEPGATWARVLDFADGLGRLTWRLDVEGCFLWKQRAAELLAFGGALGRLRVSIKHVVPLKFSMVWISMVWMIKG